MTEFVLRDLFEEAEHKMEKEKKNGIAQATVGELL